MRLYTIKRPPGTVPIGALLMAPLFALPMGAWMVENRVLEFGICGMRRAFDIPCLSCGGTRATLSLLGGSLVTAFSIQPMIVSIYFIIAIWGIASFGTFLRDKKLVLDLTRTQDIIFKASLIVVPLLNWAYLIWQDV